MSRRPKNVTPTLIKGLAYTYLFFKKEASSQEIYNYINSTDLINAKVGLSPMLVARNLRRFTMKSTRERMFLLNDGLWSINPCILKDEKACIVC